MSKFTRNCLKVQLALLLSLSIYLFATDTSKSADYVKVLLLANCISVPVGLLLGNTLKE